MRGRPGLPRTAATRSPVDRRILGCVSDSRTRKRIELALRDHAFIQWYDSFAALRRGLETEGRMCTAVVGMRDDRGDTAVSFAHSVRAGATGTAIVACCNLGEGSLQAVSELAVAGVHDVLFTGLNDDGHSARMVIFGACLGGAADLVIGTMSPVVPTALLRFVDLAVRRPRELRRVGDVAGALNVPRQTIGRWCRLHRFIGPEELLMWVRLLLATAMLEATDRTLESIAYEMQYGSPTALRNRIREYTGMTATDLRQGGLRLMQAAFERRVEAVRREWPVAPARKSAAAG